MHSTRAHEDIFDYNFLCNGQAIYNILESTESGEGKVGCVPIDLSTNLVEQPIDLFLNRPAHTTILQVGITARPVTSLARSLFNRPQRDNYARKSRT
jgi:hypothetical protein